MCKVHGGCFVFFSFFDPFFFLLVGFLPLVRAVETRLFLYWLASRCANGAFFGWVASTTARCKGEMKRKELVYKLSTSIMSTPWYPPIPKHHLQIARTLISFLLWVLSSNLSAKPWATTGCLDCQSFAVALRAHLSWWSRWGSQLGIKLSRFSFSLHMAGLENHPVFDITPSFFGGTHA